MPRENKIQSRKRNRLLRATGAVLPTFDYVEHKTVKATHVSESGHRYEFKRVREKDVGNLVGQTIEIGGYRASREQLALGCDGCPRRHIENNPICHANAGGVFTGERESWIDPARLDQDPSEQDEDMIFTPMGENGGVIYKGNVVGVKGFGRHKAGQISLLVTSQQLYTNQK